MNSGNRNSDVMNWNMIVDQLDVGLVVLNEIGQLIKHNPIAIDMLGFNSERISDRVNVYNRLTLIDTMSRQILNNERFLKDCLNGLINSKRIIIKNNETQVEQTLLICMKPLVQSKNPREIVFTMYPDVFFEKDTENNSQNVQGDNKDFEAWHALFENFGDGFWYFNLAENKFVYSSQWKTMLGYKDQELDTSFESWKKRIHPDDVNLVLAKLEEQLNGDSIYFSCKYRVKCYDDSYKLVIDHGKIINRGENAEAIRRVGTYRDIPTQEQFQNSLNESLSKQRELNELKTRFVSMASHEFRTPLATILLSLETLEAYWSKMTEENRHLKIIKIKNNVVFLKNVIEKVLSLTQVESGMLKLKPTTIDIVKQLKLIVSDYLDNKSVKHHIEFNPKLDKLNIDIDKQIIEQVFKNIISNSIKYSPEGSKITVNLIEEEDQIKIEISDEGLGIPEDEIKNLFTPFFRASNVTNLRGAGLGLSLTREFVLLHQGQIEVRSVLSKGTTITITLPKTLSLIAKE